MIDRDSSASKANQTDARMGAQSDMGSSASRLASTVVPRTSASSAPSDWAAARESFAGGAAWAAGAVASANAAKRTKELRDVMTHSLHADEPSCFADLSGENDSASNS